MCSAEDPTLFRPEGTERGEPLVLNLGRAFKKYQPDKIFFIGDSDTSANFEFSRQAAFLAWFTAAIFNGSSPGHFYSGFEYFL